MAEPNRTCAPGPDAALRGIFTRGFEDTINAALQGPSGLVVARFASLDEGTQQQSKVIPATTFVAGITMRPQRVILRQNGRTVRSGTLATGTAIFSEPDQRTEAETQGAWETLFLTVPVHHVASVCEASGFPVQGRGSLTFLNGSGGTDGKLLALGRESLVELAAPGPFSRLRVDLIGHEIIIRLLTEHSTLAGSIAAEHGRRARGGLAPGQLRRAIEIMEAVDERELTLNSLAAAAGCSPTHFSRAFKQSTGLPPFAWLLHRRVERAQAMLEGGRMPIAQIALAAGFAAQPQFTTAFRRVTGSTPAAWRRARSG